MCEGYIATLGETTGEHAGTIINVASQVGLVEMNTTSAYAISKLSVIKLTEMIAGGRFRILWNLIVHNVNLVHRAPSNPRNQRAPWYCTNCTLVFGQTRRGFS
jgi:NAD(P)-dependent dehydrogenase (short-subunit alcohol dehydrogenase family)